MAIELTLAQITKLAGGTPRRMKQLANEGVFIPSSEGLSSRTARTYPISEAAIACIIARLDGMKTKPDALAGIAEYLRSIYRVPHDYGFETHTDGHAFWAREILLTTASEPRFTATAEEKKKLALRHGLDEFPRGKPSDISADEMHRIRHWVVLERARTGEPRQASLYIKEDGGWLFWVSGQPNMKDDDIDAYVVLNLHRILSVLR